MSQNLFRLIGAITLTAAIASCQPKDVTGWSKIKWGMTLAEAREVFGERASRVDPQGPDSQSFTVKDVMIGDIAATALVVSARNSNRVGLVTIQATKYELIVGDELVQSGAVANQIQTFSTLKRLLIEKYGTPKNEDHKPDGRGYMNSTVLWVFPTTSIILELHEPSASEVQQALRLRMPTSGHVTVQYRAIDKSLDSL